MRDYYAILGVEHTATAEEIRAAYRICAKRHHPDTNPDDLEAAVRFRLVKEAADVLRNEESRAAYDHAWKKTQQRTQKAQRAAPRKTERDTETILRDVMREVGWTAVGMDAYFEYFDRGRKPRKAKPKVVRRSAATRKRGARRKVFRRNR